MREKGISLYLVGGSWATVVHSEISPINAYDRQLILPINRVIVCLLENSFEGNQCDLIKMSHNTNVIITSHKKSKTRPRIE